jgi:recombination protein RecA
MPPKMTNLSQFRDKLGTAYGDRMVQAPQQKIEVVSTGSLTLDYALRVGGWKRGGIHELVGAPDSAKTLIAIYSMVQQQLAYPGLAVAFVDMEKTWSYDWAWKMGLLTDPDHWVHLRPETSEEASDMLRECVRSGFYSMATVDSIGGMESAKALYGGKGKEDEIRDADKEMVGKNAQVITRMVKHVASLASQTSTTVLLINQLRVVISSMALSDVSAGPKAMQHATTTKVRMARMGGDGREPKKLKFDGTEEIVSVCFKAHVERSKVAAPGAVAEFWVSNRDTEKWGEAGINVADEYATIGVRSGAIERAGSYYTVPGADRVNGREAMVSLLAERPELLENVRQKIFEGASA